jgi:hypothetical protein
VAREVPYKDLAGIEELYAAFATANPDAPLPILRFGENEIGLRGIGEPATALREIRDATIRVALTCAPNSDRSTPGRPEPQSRPPARAVDVVTIATRSSSR